VTEEKKMSFKNKGVKEIKPTPVVDYSTIKPKIATSGYAQVVPGSEVPYMPSTGQPSLYGIHPYWDDPLYNPISYGTWATTSTSTLPYTDFNKQMAIEQERAEIADLLTKYLNIQLWEFYDQYRGSLGPDIGTQLQVLLDVDLRNLQTQIHLVAQVLGIQFSHPSNVGKTGSPNVVPSVGNVWVESWQTPETKNGLEQLLAMHQYSTPLTPSFIAPPSPKAPSIDLVKEALRDKLDLKLKLDRREGPDCIIVFAQILYDGEVIAEDEDQIYLG
jgi:hypothetical protein